MPMPLPFRPLVQSVTDPEGPVDPAAPSSGAELVTADGRALPLEGARLTGEARGGLARCVLEQRFANRYAETLRVRYRMPLPADGAVSAYEFEIGGRAIAGRVEPRAAARQRFETAVAAGQTAALLEQDRDDLFTQELGNVPPGEAIVARITVDLRLAWLPEGEWELRFPTVIGPRYVGTGDSADDARATHIAAAPGEIAARVEIELEVRDAIPRGGPYSPSHAVEARGGRVALLGERGARLDRDIVLRWAGAAPEVGVALDAARLPAADGFATGEAYGLVTIVPPAPDAGVAALPRDLIFLIDTSGSMTGAPLAQAQRVVALAIESLDEGDRLELIEFASRPRRYRPAPIAATAPEKAAAIAWVMALAAGGATEMAAGVAEALRPLRRGAQRQVIVVTDGYIGGERQILRQLERGLPGTCRLHVVGVGSAVNRSLSAALARAGRGVEVLAGIASARGTHDDAERAAARLVARTRAPVLVGVELAGSALVAQAPARVPDVFAGAPVLAAVALRPEGGELVVRGALASGAWERRVRVPALCPGEGRPAIPPLYARERVADLEARAAVGASDLELDREIEALGVAFQIATRLTSWVAIDPRRRASEGGGEGPGRFEDMPQELPLGTSAESFGLRGAGASPMPLMRGAGMMMKSGAAADASPSWMGPPMAGPSGPPMIESLELLREPERVATLGARGRSRRWYASPVALAVYALLVAVALLLWWLLR